MRRAVPGISDAKTSRTSGQVNGSVAVSRSDPTGGLADCGIDDGDDADDAATLFAADVVD